MYVFFLTTSRTMKRRWGRINQHIGWYLNFFGVNFFIGVIKSIKESFFDYDVFSNWGNWQYLAGVGHDPRSRVFNVLKQIKNYDQDYSYIKSWSPFDSEVEIETKLKKIYSGFPID